MANVTSVLAFTFAASLSLFSRENSADGRIPALLLL